VLDGRHDRIWGFGREQYAVALEAFAGAPEKSSEPQDVDLRRFLRLYGPAGAGDTNPYRLDRFFIGNLPDESNFRLHAPISISWCITNRCQSACVYCCTESHPTADSGLSTAENLEIVQRLADWGILRLIVGGGEPLLVPDLGTVLERAADLGIRPTLATNGLLISDANLDVLRKTIMLAQVSLDSLEDAKYAYLRGTKGGLERVKVGLQLLRDARVPIRVVTVLSEPNAAEIEQIGDYAASVGARQWFVFAVQPSGRAARNFSKWKPRDLPSYTRRLVEVGNRHPEMSVSLWGTSSQDQTAIYVTSRGQLEIHDYGTGQSAFLSSLEGAPSHEIERVWSNVDARTQRATLLNFTRSERNPSAGRQLDQVAAT
jgi:molybdenum cofactor biosynthesis enzyme MoaA